MINKFTYYHFQKLLKHHIDFSMNPFITEYEPFNDPQRNGYVYIRKIQRSN